MSVGIDIVDISRIKKIDREKFCKKILSPDELKLPLPKDESLAAVFAAKEAFSKAVGTGFRDFDFKDISLMHDFSGRPYLTFSKKVEKLLQLKGVTSCQISLSHEKTYAVAIVTLETEKKYMFYEKSIDKLKNATSCAITPDKIKKILKKREPQIHKGDCGRLFIIAGSLGLTGAAIMSSSSAIRSGAGLVTLACPKSLNTVFETASPEVMTLPLSDTNGILNCNDIDIITERAKKSDCVLIGPGLGTSKDIFTILEKIMGCCENLIIDADGINVLSRNIDILKGHKSNIILTPHIGEFSRMTGKDCKDILNNCKAYALDFAKKYNVTVVLKSHQTIVAFPDGKIDENLLGNPGMATGGTGDVLAGCIASFCAQGFGICNSASLGVYIHSLAADMAECDKGEYGLIPSDIIAHLPYAIKYSI